ncbi:MAG: hypothetical protein MHM6MM_005462 [Cercozoa sp. M6MM]
MRIKNTPLRGLAHHSLFCICFYNHNYITMSDFNNGIFDCTAPGVGFCLFACCCTPCANASIRNEYDSSNWCFNCLCVTPSVLRNVIREGYGVDGNCVNDIIFGCCCAPCSACQLKAEVDARGAKTGGMTM